MALLTSSVKLLQSFLGSKRSMASELGKVGGKASAVRIPRRLHDSPRAGDDTEKGFIVPFMQIGAQPPKRLTVTLSCGRRSDHVANYAQPIDLPSVPLVNRVTLYERDDNPG